MTPASELHIRVGSLSVLGASRVEARRLADALPQALERALAAPPTATARGGTRADAVAVEIAAHVRRSLETTDRRDLPEVDR